MCSLSSPSGAAGVFNLPSSVDRRSIAVAFVAGAGAALIDVVDGCVGREDGRRGRVLVVVRGRGFPRVRVCCVGVSWVGDRWKWRWVGGERGVL